MSLQVELHLYDADKSVLSGDEMHFAAKVIRKANRQYGMKEDALWRPSELDTEAETVDSDNKDIDALADDIAGLDVGYGCIADYSARLLATQLARKGWTKQHDRPNS
jgi:hypothetical protein